MSGRSAADAFFSEDESAESVTWDVTIPTDDDSILRRRRASSPIKVLYDIDNNKQRYGGDFWGDYDLFSICLSVIDQVALAMGISAGRTWDEIMEYAMSQARRQSPTGGEQQWRDVAERVVVSLVTTDAESVNYIAYQDSSPEWLSQKVRILYVNASGEEGTEYLRASEQAINIFLDALDLDPNRRPRNSTGSVALGRHGQVHGSKRGTGGLVPVPRRARVARNRTNGRSGRGVRDLFPCRPGERRRNCRQRVGALPERVESLSVSLGLRPGRRTRWSRCISLHLSSGRWSRSSSPCAVGKPRLNGAHKLGISLPLQCVPLPAGAACGVQVTKALGCPFVWVLPTHLDR